jgi:hypothetical protein
MLQQLPSAYNNIAHGNGFGMFVNNTLQEHDVHQTNMTVSGFCLYTLQLDTI